MVFSNHARIETMCRPYCNHENTQVEDSRHTEDGTVVRRRCGWTSCLACFSTFKRVHLLELNVLKKDGRKVSFDRDELAHSIRVVMRNCPVSTDQVEHLFSHLFGLIEGLRKNVIKSSRIGPWIKEEIRNLDTVANVHFASV